MRNWKGTCFRYILKFAWLISALYSVNGTKPTSGRSDMRVFEVDERIENTVACEREKIKLKCNKPSTVLLFYSAYYGRTQVGHVVCRARGDRQKDDVICGQLDVTMKLRRICEGRTRCKFEVNDATFGNICSKVYKYLKVLYTCVPRLRKRKRKKERSTTVTPTMAVTINSTTPFARQSNTSTNMSVSSFGNVTVTPSSNNNTNETTPANETYEKNITSTVAPQENENASILLPQNRTASTVEGRTTARSTVEYSTRNTRVLMVLTWKRYSKMSLLGSLILLVMHITANIDDYVPVLLASVGITLGCTILMVLGCICVKRMKRKDEPAKVERVNGYRYKTNSPTGEDDSLPGSSKGSQCGSNTSLEKKWPPPPPEACPPDNEDNELKLPTREGRVVGLATLPKTNNTNNKNLDGCKSPGSGVEYVIVQQRNGSKLYLNPMATFQNESLLRNANKTSRLVDPDPITTELKSLWKGGLDWHENDESRTENKERMT